MARSNLVSKRTESKKLIARESCPHKAKDRSVLWRDIVHGGLWSQESHTWTQRKHTSMSTYISKEPYYERLRSKAQKRSSRIVEISYSNPFLPPEIRSVREALNKSRDILKLEDDWDDAGSIGYAESTWFRVERFLMGNALKLWRSHKTCFEPPDISPGPEGSFDLHWKTADRELLINVPARPEASIGFYGDDNREGTENAIRGKDLGSRDAEWIFLWLMK
jgi:hypothetical protein